MATSITQHSDSVTAMIQELYRDLPQVNDLLLRESLQRLADTYARDRVVAAARAEIGELRQEIGDGHHTQASLHTRLQTIEAGIEARLHAQARPSLRRVINATGVILQTNLGRAPLSKAALARVAETAGGYCNLEFDLDTGERSRRDVHAEDLLLRVLAARCGMAEQEFSRTRAAAVVNNCAAATFLGLNTLAAGGEVIVSRGELVEIGGGFRIPEILQRSGARLREVGTTNRTRVADYAAAIGPDTRLILRVHQANFHMVGFTERPDLEELCTLGAERGVPIFDDQGTGALVDLRAFGLESASSLQQSVASGVALVAASGDKLLGGPQCGLLVGKREAVEQARTNPLFRALRVDKMVYATLEATLQAYLNGDELTIPAIAMMQISAAEIQHRCETWAQALQGKALQAEVLAVRSLLGGGTTPSASLPSFAVALRHHTMHEAALARQLRSLDPPIVGRISGGQVLLDLRTVPPEQDLILLASINASFSAQHLDPHSPKGRHPR